MANCVPWNPDPTSCGVMTHPHQRQIGICPELSKRIAIEIYGNSSTQVGTNSNLSPVWIPLESNSARGTLDLCPLGIYVPRPTVSITDSGASIAGLSRSRLRATPTISRKKRGGRGNRPSRPPWQTCWIFYELWCLTRDPEIPGLCCLTCLCRRSSLAWW